MTIASPAPRQPPRPAPHEGVAPGLAAPAVSVVVPVLDEAGAIEPLLEEIDAALGGRERFEVIVVDDGSRDDTADRVRESSRRHPWLRLVRHAAPYGQSAAIRTGVRAARGALVVTLDGDGQNDPADVPAMLDAYRDSIARSSLGLVAGQRARRNDGPLRRLSSRVANGVRARVLGDGVADTGCGLKVFSREAFLALPYFDHMHRFLPSLMQREGYAVLLRPVRHRPRLAGRSKYGVWNRLPTGIVDLLGVLWLARRCRRPTVEPEG